MVFAHGFDADADLSPTRDNYFAQANSMAQINCFLKLKDSARYASDAYSGHAMVLLKLRISRHRCDFSKMRCPNVSRTPMHTTASASFLLA